MIQTFRATALLLALSWPFPALAKINLPAIRLPEGFRISLLTDKVPGARSMTLTAGGTLFVGSIGEGKVYAVRGTEVTVVASGLDKPNGVAFREGALYVAEVSRILRFDGVEDRVKNGTIRQQPKPVVVTEAFPSDTHHGWKFIAFGPDGLLYVPVGAPCNICEPDAAKYSALFRMKPDGSGLERFAAGIRNTVGFDWAPATRELWFTDNGRDLLGDDLPPDELNRAPSKGMSFGYPYCHGKSIADPEFGSKQPCSKSTPAEMELGPHVAALGMRFYGGKQFPAAYQGQVFIAEHGSWNRSKKSGYRVSLVKLKGGRAVSYETFAEGWLQGQDNWGRPVDVQVASDGALLVSDDYAGAIYKIEYRK